MNVDAKIQAMALAHSLEKVLPTTIFKEQNGFIKMHHLYYNLHSVVIYSKETKVTPEVISINAEKPFDQLE